MAIVIDPDGVETATIRELVDIRGKRILDLGCGDGRLSLRCVEAGAASAFGVDPDEVEVAKARRATPRVLRDRVGFEVADATAVDLPAGEFDLALFSWSL